MVRTTSSRTTSRVSSKRTSKCTSKVTSKTTSKSARNSSDNLSIASSRHSHETKARESLKRSLEKDFPDMTETTKKKLENGFINKVNRTKQESWYKARRAGRTKEDWLRSEARKIEKDYASRRHNEDEVVSRYKDSVSSKPNQVITVKNDDGKVDIIKTDDNGKIYQVNNNILPNKNVKVGGYNYKTDEIGRTTVASGTLQKKDHKGKRAIKHSMDEIGKGDQLKSDNKGHLIGDQFNGLSDLINLVPQDSTLNSENGDYNKLEHDLKSYMEEGHTVTLRVDVIYDENDISSRPIAFYMTYSIDGEYYERSFKNQANQED